MRNRHADDAPAGEPSHRERHAANAGTGFERPQVKRGERPDAARFEAQERSANTHGGRRRASVRTRSNAAGAGRGASSALGALSGKKIAIAAAVVVALIALVLFISNGAYSNSVTSKMALNDDAVTASLVAPDNDADASYVLVAADLQPNDQIGYDGASALDLVRIDPNGPKVSVLAIPANLQTDLSNGEVAAIGREQSIGGDAALIKEVSSYAGVDIAHYVKIDRAGLSSLVDSLGGVDVDVPEEVDDPHVAPTYVAAGQQTLSGDQAVSVAVAANYATGSSRKAQNNALLLQAISAKLSSLSGFDEMTAVDSLAGDIKTDLSSDALRALLDQLSDYDFGSAINCVVPGSDSRNDDDQVEFYPSSSSWNKMQTAFSTGQDPAAASNAEVAKVDPSKYSVTVMNGAGQTGAANQAADALKKAGYTITKTGNTDQAVYTETLVVYKKKASKTAAQAVARTLGTGRAVSASIYYSFDSDLEVIVGSDYSAE
jgi:LCP family protein required for cell wall assembly